ncbi:MAG: hypothetical protein AB7U62_03925 [Pseudolabrys sp.]
MIEIQKDTESRSLEAGWPLITSKLKNPPLWLSSFLIIIGFVFGLWLLFLTCAALFHLTGDILGGSPDRISDAVKALLPIAAAAVGLPLIIWRLAILNRQTKTAEAKTQIDRETHYTSIFSRSIDQLGQIREVKERYEHKGAWETVSKTVANIEVRLGGIHSLARLAEESSRDREKIENTLLSYIRENSWSARNGDSSTAPRLKLINKYEWSFEYLSDEIDEDSKNAFEDWKNKTDEEFYAQKKWASQQPETRVDVNEAIESLPKIRQFFNSDSKHTFFECLFVGRIFRSHQIRASEFERCIFINCRFEIESVSLKLFLCRFFSCNIKSQNCILLLHRCYTINSSVSGSKSKISAITSHFYSTYFSSLSDFEINANDATFYNGGFLGSENLILNAPASYFINFYFGSDALAPGSSLEKTVLAESRLAGSNLKAVQGLQTEQLKAAKGNVNTVLPDDVASPEWEEDDIDEIPF